MKGLETVEQQRLFLKAVGNVLANEDIGLIKDSIEYEYGSLDYHGDIFKFKIGFLFDAEKGLGSKIIEQCQKEGLDV